ncbi:Sorting nexin mvp1 [Umbelopsis nana]
MRPPSMSSKSIATSIYTSQFDEEEDPWGNFPGTDNATASQTSLRNGQIESSLGEEDSEMSLDLTTIPNIYRNIYNKFVTAHGVTLQSIEQVIAASGIREMQGQQIFKLIGKTQLLSEREVYCILACVALAQRGEDITHQNLNACRFDPPIPYLHMDELEESNDDPSNTARQMSTGSNESHEAFVNIDKPNAVTVQIAPEKEGRMIPNLPPKNLGGRTDAFLEKRRKGLARFLNALLRHPVIKNDEIVHVFFTEPSELGAWRKQNTPSLDDEFLRLQINQATKSPTEDWEQRFEKAQRRNESTIKAYNEMCLAMERIAKRQANQAKDYIRYASCLRRVRLDSELVAKHLQKARVQLQDTSDALYATTLEQLKRQRDLCLSFKDLCARKQRFWGNALENFEKRLKSSQIKVNQNRGIPGMEAEVQKLDNAIKQDKEAIVQERKRRRYIARCIEEEIRYLQDQESYALVLHRNFTQLQAQSEQNMFDIWNELQNKLGA